MKNIIRTDGNTIPLADYQAINNLPADKVSAHFSVAEMDCAGELLIAAPLLNLLEAFRARIDKPVKINSGYRTLGKQAELKAEGFKAATTSPHTVGMAADIDTVSHEQTLEYVAILQEVARVKGLQVRIGYKQYWDALKQTFVHVDVCPMYYAKGKPFYNRKHPAAWENQIIW